MSKSQWMWEVEQGEHLAGHFLGRGWVDAKLDGRTWEETIFLPSSSGREGQVPRAARTRRRWRRCMAGVEAEEEKY